ncbi:hypothetical protein BGZ59_003765, partial [Podila verticillata]
VALSEALKTNLTLTTLNLGFNSIYENGAVALSEALKTNSSLTTLNLGVNSIGDDGAQMLSEALKANSTLITLDLGSNSIGDNGAQALAEAFKANSVPERTISLNLKSRNVLSGNQRETTSDFVPVVTDLFEQGYTHLATGGFEQFQESMETRD